MKAFAKLTCVIAAALLALLLASCANIGSPEGGPRDFAPPIVTSTNPPQGAVNVKSNKIEISFNEIVNLKDQQKKVSVSPVQHTAPLIRSLGKKITVELRDTLLPDATYVIDFANAIEDNNEGNQLDGFAISFSTGDNIDTLQVSGIVLRANDLEPMQHVLVGLHSNLSDTAFTTLPFDRVTRTNSRGQFTLMGVAPGKYNIFALNDPDGDNRMNRAEDYAYLDQIIIPSAEAFTSTDTIFTFDHKVDTIVERTHTRFLPDNILLTMSNENYRPQYLKRSERPDSNRIHILFAAPADTLPRLEVLSPRPQQRQWAVVERTENNDSLFYWITDTSLIKSDSITIAMTYLRTDSTDALSPATDTLHLVYRKPPYLIKEEKERLKEQQEIEKRAASLEKKLAEGKQLNEEEIEQLREARRPKKEPRFSLQAAKTDVIDIGDSIIISAPLPITVVNPDGIHLQVKRDTTWVTLTGVPPLVPAPPTALNRLAVPIIPQPDSAYRLIVDSLSIATIYGMPCDSLKFDVKVKPIEEYASLALKITGTGDSAVVELLDAGEKVVSTAMVIGGEAEFLFVKPGTYFARLFIDTNRNQRWDSGNFRLHTQPEEVYYYPKPLRLRRNWDVEQSWNIFELPLDLQKPESIRKNRPEKSKIEQEIENRDRKNRKGSDLENEEEDEFNSQGFQRNTYSGNKYQDYQNNRNR